jgi:hypothetical protein
MISPRQEGEGREVWTVGDLLKWTEDYFRRLELPSPRLDAELLLAHALGATRIDLYTQYQKSEGPATSPWLTSRAAASSTASRST